MAPHPKKFTVKIDPSQITTREINPEQDLNFILSTWLRSYKGSTHGMDIPDNIYYAYHQNLIKQILLKPTNNVTVLADPESPDQIIGYIVYNTVEPIVYYTYIKFPFRHLGLGRYLFEGIRKHFPENATVTCTHKCRRWSRLAKILNLQYNPYVITNREVDQSGSN